MHTAEELEDEQVGQEQFTRFLAGMVELSHAPTLGETIGNLARGLTETAERILSDPGAPAARRDFARYVLSDLAKFEKVVAAVYDPDIGQTRLHLERLIAAVAEPPAV